MLVLQKYFPFWSKIATRFSSMRTAKLGFGQMARTLGSSKKSCLSWQVASSYQSLAPPSFVLEDPAHLGEAGSGKEQPVVFLSGIPICLGTLWSPLSLTV